MIQPATSGIAIPDPRSGKTRGWLIAQIVFQCLTVAGALATLLLWPITMSTRDFSPIFIALALWILVAVIGFVCAMIAFGYQSATRRELDDALTRFGHGGTPAKKLLSGKHPLVPSPAGVLLQLRRETDDQGHRWILVDAFPMPAAAAATMPTGR
ncbi:hypothetical protein ACFVU2_09645 [Leifsonia sp. NPDC058194]|uniref:hypothetical protein n=1 Tax=Leifsonia sp. NPDC058194 TaxID=3346374 RepID=UPI0036D81D95